MNQSNGNSNNNPVNHLTVPSVSITTARTGASAKANELGMREMQVAAYARRGELDLTIEDRFGKPVKPREWFVVPLQVIDEAVERIRDGTITALVYDAHTARLVARLIG